MKSRHGKKKRLTAAVVLLGILVIGWAVISYAAEDEYKVHHNITIDLGGGTCDKIYYQSQIDNGDNAGQWNDDLRIGEYLADRYGEYHTIIDYKASVPKADAVTSNYYDCVGVTPYVRIGAVSRDGYILKGWEVSGDKGWHTDYGKNGIRVEIGAYTEEDIVIKAIWERQTFTVHYSAGVAADRGIKAYLPDDEDAYYGRGDELTGFTEGASADNGLIFTGWSFDRYGDSGILEPEDLSDYNKDVTVYAIWDYIITFDNNTDAEVTGYMENITSKLGTPKGGYYEAKSCAFDGMDKFWYYDSFTLQGYQKNGVDVVYSVTFMDDTVKTKEGIKIGDSKDKVTSAYGSSYKEENGQIKYESGNMVLSFAIKDNAVTSIVYSVK